MNTDWYSYDDNANGGASIITPLVAEEDIFPMTAGGAVGTANAVKIDYTVNAGTLTYDPFVGFGFDLQEDFSALDLTGSNGISFYHKGDACVIQVPLATNTDEDYYLASVEAHTDWTKVIIPWNSLGQSGWGTAISFDPAQVTKL
ncbi:MAG TPA: hypothetical protein DCR93_16530, partial [Cytophagales bacterium]|nr:hypothetical protein [Cytophagales bacterium]